MFTAMLMDAYRNERPRIGLTYRTYGQLFNKRPMHFQPRVSTTSVHELLFANNCSLNAPSHPVGTTRYPRSIFALPPTSAISADRFLSPSLPSSSSIASTSAVAVPVPTITAHDSDAPTNFNLLTVDVGDVDSVHTCPHCKSIAQRLTNQCLELQHTPDASASTALPAPAHTPTARTC
nr:unnamed protein product [Spirometra erinaceieuropaei]